jgi:iron complex outermembrane receptor protein
MLPFRSTLAVGCAIGTSANAIAGATDATADTAGEGGFSAASSTALEEVLVTAQRREERVQDVPIPLSVINTIELTENNQVKLTDKACCWPYWPASSRVALPLVWMPENPSAN